MQEFGSHFLSQSNRTYDYSYHRIQPSQVTPYNRSLSTSRRSNSKNMKFQMATNNIIVMNERIDGLLNIVSRGRSGEKISSFQANKMNFSSQRQYSKWDKQKQSVKTIKQSEPKPDQKTLERSKKELNNQQTIHFPLKEQSKNQQTLTFPLIDHDKLQINHQSRRKFKKNNEPQISQWWENMLDQKAENPSINQLTIKSNSFNEKQKKAKQSNNVSEERKDRGWRDRKQY